jgi:predicted helicase
MSLQLIDQYYNKLDKIIQYGGSDNEQSIRDAFRELLGYYAEKRNLMLISELKVMGTNGAMVQPDGTLKNALRLEYGHWESKDSKDNLDAEIDNKIKKGYPLKNIIFEDSNTSVLIQHGEVIQRINMKDRNELDSILNTFINFEHAEVVEFSKALDQFILDLPNIIEALRELIEKEAKENNTYISARDEFLENCKQEINPEFTIYDIREMLIQHILTEEIFNAVFDESQFHMENNIARKLDAVIRTFFTGDKKRNTLDSIKHYYNAISSAAKNIIDHHEKQKFLKIIYENFYKSYNPKAADRLGVVYTPNEIVKFMLESTDYLLYKHFGKTLANKNIEILDPATGTGTFICDLIEYLPSKDLVYKYKNEIHANEVAILPYYVANLNIEYTFKQKMGNYSEFPNLCFVDTLDNTDALLYAGKQELLFGLSSENAE